MQNRLVTEKKTAGTPATAKAARKKLPPLHVKRFTSSLFMKLLVVLLWVYVLISLGQIAQRALWLIRDFTPLRETVQTNYPLLYTQYEWIRTVCDIEIYLMSVYEGTILFSFLLSLLTAIGTTRVLASSKPRSGLMLRRVCAIRGFFFRVEALLCLLASAVIVYPMLHYRLSVQWVGVVSALGLAGAITMWLAARLQHNIRRILADVNHAKRSQFFTNGGGAFGLVRLQSLIMVICQLLPLAVVLAEAYILAALGEAFANVMPFINDLKRLILGDGITGIAPMYTLDFFKSAIAAGCYAMLIPLYSVYCNAHERRLPRMRDWQKKHSYE